MNAIHAADPAARTTPPATAGGVSSRSAAQPERAPRVDLYAPIHKALRSFMADTLVRIGRIDIDDPSDRADALGQLGALLALCRSHLAHENEHVHAAIEARAPTASTRIADEHVEHLESIAALEAEATALEAAAPAQRTALALRLYRHLALFVAENFQHMQIEETVHNAALWSHYTDGELMALHGRLMASVPPAENLLVARWMLPALSPAERAAMLLGARGQMPPPVFDAIVEHVRPHIDAAGWAKLARALGRPPQGVPPAGA